ncbi:OB-fold domain-containing protein [Tsukamurella sp. 8F]|uniref:Zn-ribbon domain-containing OB-fold protein n=1 Tax=unclassified Tsukamurella TaxID=2633480 RepID=UPI0023B9E46D|nr:MULTISPECIES: OB-fold nucleic acid binding domain-containing protein [unclassified Tsukamurella]MDF0530725.1 OB-fold domain-containing protein [Tsukamurella sp. 8J]MDF0587926.1 OB-fold domain-containing protein [Tsukamurella sp. 8F]
MSAEFATLAAPLDISFDYTRSLGPVLGRFAGALAQRRIIGARGSDGRVHVPPPEYDPVTAAPLGELVEVATTGTVVSWSWCAEPVRGQPFDSPFSWALIRLDGADTPLLHAVDAPRDAMRTGMRVRARWVDSPVGAITDVACFEPGEGEGEPSSGADLPEAIAMLTAPVDVHLTHTASREESRYLHALAEGRLIGQRCPVCDQVYVPPRSACPTDGVPTTTEVELPDTGIVTTFCIVNVPFLGQRIKPPYVGAYILLDGADIPFLHLVLGCAADQVRMGMRVRAAWRPRDEWGPTPANISHFEPTGEADAEYDTFRRHL